ncbi:ABC-type transport auxiliary lipoprotein family protein [Caldimonas sp. KR1-144]|uniref:ABC-type transport auxiliary lipoprotein family protein n=1 Tax=Caldimonas sp. KR1-144 TaxID=3400911 RepID=UPI003C0204DC
MSRRMIAALAGAIVIAGCSIVPTAPVLTLYDLGPPPTASAVSMPAPLRIADVDAPPSLEGAQMLYRLQYADPYQHAAYRDSRWAAPPATLVGQRMRQAAALGDAALTAPAPLRMVHVELDRFEQVFSAPGTSRVVVQLRARVLDAATRTRGSAERSFSVERDAPSADAAGAARAMAGAVDEVTRQVLGWAAALP